MTLRYFFDTEFIEDGTTIDLLSIGIVSEDRKRELYYASTDCDIRKASPWVREHVLPKLPPLSSPLWRPRDEIRRRLEVFIYNGPYPPNDTIEMWAYYADYDWVALCQLFGRMVDLPTGFPKHAMDVKQLLVMLGSPELAPLVSDKEHDALEDARWCHAAYERLWGEWDDIKRAARRLPRR